MEFNNYCNRKYGIILLLLFALYSCNNYDSKIVISNNIMLSCPENWVLIVDSTGIDTDHGIIIVDNDDTLKFEYGKGINNLIKPLKTIVPVQQKGYWDSVGMLYFIGAKRIA